MIQWSLTLSQNQIALLEAIEPREFGKEWDHPPFPHYVTHVRSLFNEGLIEHRDTKNAQGHMDLTRTGAFITDRGRFILRMIREDMERFLQATPPKPKKAKRENKAA